jgi:predicted kinase
VSTPRLVLFCGLPGSGKSTLARRVEAELPAVRLSGDEWLAQLELDLWDEDARHRIEVQFWRLAQDLLRLGQSVVLESGFWLRSDRDEKRLGARAIGAAVELTYLQVPVDELARRLALRATQGLWGAVPVTRVHLESYLEVFQPPDVEELALFDQPFLRPD